jgi:hypothetical protein
VYRESGHEHLTGCLVIPIIDAGRVVVLCGHRTDRPGPAIFASGLPGGVLPALPTRENVLVVVSIRDALAVLAVVHDAVVAPGRSSGFSRRDLTQLANRVRHATVIGEDVDGLTDRLRKHGIAVDVTSPGAPIAELLAGARDRRRALGAVLTDAG